MPHKGSFWTHVLTPRDPVTKQRRRIPRHEVGKDCYCPECRTVVEEEITVPEGVTT